MPREPHIRRIIPQGPPLIQNGPSQFAPTRMAQPPVFLHPPPPTIMTPPTFALHNTVLPDSSATPKRRRIDSSDRSGFGHPHIHRVGAMAQSLTPSSPMTVIEANRTLLNLLTKDALVELIAQLMSDSADCAKLVDEQLQHHQQCKRLMIRNVSYNIDKADFSLLFEKFGTVEDCVIVRDKVTKKSRGFGFVRYSEIGPVRAVLTQEMLLRGRSLTIKLAASGEDNPESPNKGGGGGFRQAGKIFSGGEGNHMRIVFVRNLSAMCTNSSLKAAMQVFGNSESVYIIPDTSAGVGKRCGVVAFDSPEAAAASVRQSQIVIDGQATYVSYVPPDQSYRHQSNNSEGIISAYNSYGQDEGFGNMNQGSPQGGANMILPYKYPLQQQALSALALSSNTKVDHSGDGGHFGMMTPQGHNTINQQQDMRMSQATAYQLTAGSQQMPYPILQSSQQQLQQQQQQTSPQQQHQPQILLQQLSPQQNQQGTSTVSAGPQQIQQLQQQLQQIQHQMTTQQQQQFSQQFYAAVAGASQQQVSPRRSQYLGSGLTDSSAQSGTGSDGGRSTQHQGSRSGGATTSALPVIYEQFRKGV